MLSSMISEETMQMRHDMEAYSASQLLLRNGFSYDFNSQNNFLRIPST